MLIDRNCYLLTGQHLCLCTGLDEEYQEMKSPNVGSQPVSKSKSCEDVCMAASYKRRRARVNVFDAVRLDFSNWG